MKLVLTTLLALLTPFLIHADLVYVPRGFEPTTARVVVAIHGCLQSSESMALGSGWNILAERHNLVILYPQLAAGTHAQDCWRYWLLENQRRGSGDLATIHQELLYWKTTLGIPQAPVMLNGISSGAALAAALLACYPEEFRAGVLNSGVSYALATNEKDALKVQSSGPKASVETTRPCDPRRFRGGVMVMHGSRDKVVHPSNAQRVLDDFIGPVESTTRKGKDNGRSFVTTDLHVDGRLIGRSVVVNGLAHAWSGCEANLRKPTLQKPWTLAALPARLMNFGEPATVRVPFFSNQGPNATQLAYDFFEEVSAWAGPQTRTR